MHLLSILLLIAQMGGTDCKCGKIDISGYAHMVYEYKMNGASGNYGLMTLPYVRVKFSGKLTDKLFFRVEPDLTSGKIRYAYADLKHIPYVTLRMGLMKVPFAYEFQPFPVTNITPTLTGATKLFTDPGLGSDGGVMAIAKLPYTELKAAILENDTTWNKGYVANITVKPIEMISLGGSYYKGHIGSWYTLYEGYFALKHPLLNLEGNYIAREKEGDFKSYGFYVQAYKKFDLPMKGHYICPAVKYGMVEPNDTLANDKTQELWIGFNVGFSKYIRLMTYFNLNLEEGTSVDNNKLVMDLHFSF
uniref:Phosphate-selective porin O and P n=1 Tax=candidate division WOR-3 bacterium TaxID=2052148 RepID=A0A7V3ZWF6_UNCW3